MAELSAHVESLKSNAEREYLGCERCQHRVREVAGLSSVKYSSMRLSVIRVEFVICLSTSVSQNVPRCMYHLLIIYCNIFSGSMGRRRNVDRRDQGWPKGSALCWTKPRCSTTGEIVDSYSLQKCRL